MTVNSISVALISVHSLYEVLQHHKQQKYPNHTQDLPELNKEKYSMFYCCILSRTLNILVHSTDTCRADRDLPDGPATHG